VPPESHSRISSVGINAIFLEPQRGGLETYVRFLLPALLEVRPDLKLKVFVNKLGRELLSQESWADQVELVTPRLIGPRGTRAIGETTLLGLLPSARGLDVLHSVALTAPLWTKATNVVTIADVTWLRQPESVGIALALLWRTLVLPAARRADRVITLSESGRSEIHEDIAIPLGSIDVVHCGSGSEVGADPMSEEAVRERFGLGGKRIVLAVSGLAPHKNVSRLVEALPLVRNTVDDVVLVLPGNPTPYGDELAARAEQMGLREAVRFPGWVNAAELEGLYRAAACFVFPSLREGFGLPLLEAMARGVPIACSNTSAIPEVAGDAALYFDPYRVDEIAGAVVRLLEDRALASELVERGRKRQAGFTWTKAARETLESYERARDRS
jgi:glycosyltransferase involved in cell wall biosynthesis